MMRFPELIVALFFLLPIQCKAQEIIRMDISNGLPIGTATAENPKPWRLVTQLNNGAITVSRYETKDQCNDAKDRAEHKPMTLEEKAYSAYFQKRAGNCHLGEICVVGSPLTYAMTGTDI